jgi:hypothetical protein
MVWKRFLPLVLALLMSAAPVAVEFCQAACLAAAPVAKHACHEHTAAPPPSTGAAIEAASHVCGHDDSIPESSLASAPVIPPAALTQSLASGLVLLSRGDRRMASLSRPPIPPLLLQAPLRL